MKKDSIKDYSDKPHENVACPLCEQEIKQGKKQESDYLLATKGYPGIPIINVICRNCGLIRINPRLTEKGYIDFYTDDFFSYLNVSERPHYINTIEKTTDPNFVTEAEKHTLPFILPFVKEGGNVLDVGAGFGQILYLLKRIKCVKTYGNEPDPESRKLASEKMGIELSPDTIEDYLKKNNLMYDYIHIEQVFEHLLRPLDILKDLTKFLNPEGTIYIGVPGQYNYQVKPDRFFELAHTYGYTPATLNLFAKKTGLKIIAIKNPLASNLEVIMAHKDSKWLEVDASLVRYGKKWNVTKNRILGRQKYYEFRANAKKILIFLKLK